MCDELVERLRESKNEQCYIGCFGICGDCKIDADLKQAADAIEELMRRCEQFQYMPLPAWIPVTERLPEEWKPVLGLIQYCEKEPPAQIVLWYIGNGHWRETWNGGMIGSTVTHWMPLPDPPKGERKDDEHSD